MGTPNLCAEPTAMSKPISPTGLRRTEAIRSVQPTTIAPCVCALAVKSDQSCTPPKERNKTYKLGVKFTNR